MNYHFTASRNVRGINKSYGFFVPNCRVTNDSKNWIINLGYGYEHTTQNCIEGSDSVVPGQEYKIHRQVLPKEGDTISHEKSGRIFRVGKVTGFIQYTAPLYENNVEVATLKFEDYYKD